MNDAKWVEIMDMIEERFGDAEFEKESTHEGKGSIERMLFNGPMGEMKLERVKAPRLLGEKTQYSRRIGGDVKVDKVYSEDEVVTHVKGYKMGTNGEWEQIEFPLS